MGMSALLLSAIQAASLLTVLGTCMSPIIPVTESGKFKVASLALWQEVVLQDTQMELGHPLPSMLLSGSPLTLWFGNFR
jgi:hypothetical protein